MSVCCRPAETELKSKRLPEHFGGGGGASCILTFSGLAHSRFPQGILFHLAPTRQAWPLATNHLTFKGLGQVSRGGCNLPVGLPGAPSKRPRGTHRRAAPRLGCTARRTPMHLQAANLHWCTSTCAAWRTPQHRHGSRDFSVMQRAP